MLEMQPSVSRVHDLRTCCNNWRGSVQQVSTASATQGLYNRRPTPWGKQCRSLGKKPRSDSPSERSCQQASTSHTRTHTQRKKLKPPRQRDPNKVHSTGCVRRIVSCTACPNSSKNYQFNTLTWTCLASDHNLTGFGKQKMPRALLGSTSEAQQSDSKAD